jgi:hypothetical protein
MLPTPTPEIKLEIEICRYSGHVKKERKKKEYKKWNQHGKVPVNHHQRKYL